MKEPMSITKELSSCKAFHAHICEIVGCCHDEVDWFRDLASVIEFTRNTLATERSARERAETQVEHYRSHYEAAVGNWAECFARAEFTEARLKLAVEALEKIDRHYLRDDIAFENLRTVKEIAQQALAQIKT